MMAVLFPAMGACMRIIGKFYVFWMGHKPHKSNSNSKLCKPDGVAIYLFTHSQIGQTSSAFITRQLNAFLDCFMEHEYAVIF